MGAWFRKANKILVLESKLREKVDHLIDSQRGFKKVYCVQDHVFIKKQIAEKHETKL